ncbi:hypothetical protein HanXRQr2_Chr11g0506961 [Helianthus annuus]|uniref:Uncharacterized protein n=1 Tax=Helianthus annuus TaxID=4232 RepID=A0A9K3N1T3_HELAN|nr:hypothetical protein HanXRQr2_Chr11g0506961 [Helianthus annuus]KAJ0876449.1 hypothetical protein HanPSC8_Chr11g0488591 [Helianthus annuus]
MRVEARVKGLFIYETEIDRRRFVDHRWKVWCEWNNITTEYLYFFIEYSYIYICYVNSHKLKRT